MCMVGGADDWTVFRFETRKAAKDHRCYECARTIHKSERYQFSTGLIDGNWLRHHVCVHCKAASEWLVVMCGGWLYGGVWEDMEAHWDDEYKLRSVGLGRLILGSRRRWRDGADPIPTWAGDCARRTMERAA